MEEILIGWQYEENEINCDIYGKDNYLYVLFIYYIHVII